MTNYVENENQLRVSAYHKDNRTENLIRQMNLTLASLGESEPSGENYPTLFIFGLPRSGTTLTYQVIAHCMELGYINNLIARFWLSPQLGIALSKAVLGKQSDSSFLSDFGKTTEPDGPHEFAYFWHHWLQVHDIKDMLEFTRENTTIDWNGLGRAVRNMQDSFESGMVFKTMYVANHIRSFATHFAMPLFIYVDRDPIDVALSILSARISYYGRADTWWATYPPNYFELSELPYDQQIAGQVHSLRSTYNDILNLIPPDLVIKLSYRQLCENPSQILTDINVRLKKLYGINVNLKKSPPDRFVVRKKKDLVTEEQRRVVNAVKAWRQSL